jgi:hypothetical protein
MEDGVDEEEARAGHLDRWIPWETEGSCPGHEIDYLFLFLSLMFVQGDPYPEFCAQRTDGGVGFTLLWSVTGFIYPFWDESL